MKLICIAGPYRAKTEHEVAMNIRRAEDLAIKVWQAGHACICPHKNTAFFGGAADDEIWLQGAVEMVRRADAVLCIDGWQQSEGARREVDAARSKKIPTFERFEDLEQWLSQGNEGK
jgi:hypothetical protein